jgi:hypothetical protein
MHSLLPLYVWPHPPGPGTTLAEGGPDKGSLLLRNYFGEKVALYFAWLGWYTYMLAPAALVGLIVFFSGFALFDASQIRWAGAWGLGALLNPASGKDHCQPCFCTPSKEICEANDIVMCPVGDHGGGYQLLSETCTFAKVCCPWGLPRACARAGT